MQNYKNLCEDFAKNLFMKLFMRLRPKGGFVLIKSFMNKFTHQKEPKEGKLCKTRHR